MTAPSSPAGAPPAIDRRRYRRVRRFFVRVVLHALWWDALLATRPLARWRRPPLPRWQALTREFRDLAIELGGVLIKLGQFLSTRVDLLPPEITGELAGLQDEVPAVDVGRIVPVVEEELGGRLGELFATFSDVPAGSASLAQVHFAVLADGSEVAVKVLRPGIGVLVETDLAALEVATRWLKLWPAARRRVDVDWLMREFRTITRHELDLEAEGRASERFASDFADDPVVVVPRVWWSHTARSVLTLERITGIKLSRTGAIRESGIDPGGVAATLYGIYMRQLFLTHYVHADPHPGNLFLLPGSDSADGMPFRIAFVDFGMTAEIPERMRNGLREFVIALGTRDARRMVEAYVTAGVLLPGADERRLVEAHQTLLDRFWGVSLGRMRSVAFGEAQALVMEYRDLIVQAPFQVQGDMLFAVRAVGLLAGLCTGLDPDFDPWAETMPFARRLAGEEATASWSGWSERALSIFALFARLPERLDRTLAAAEAGTLTVRAALDDEARRSLRRVEAAIDRLAWLAASGFLLIGGTVVRAGEAGGPLATGLLIGAAVTVVALLRRR